LTKEQVPRWVWNAAGRRSSSFVTPSTRRLYRVFWIAQSCWRCQCPKSVPARNRRFRRGRCRSGRRSSIRSRRRSLSFAQRNVRPSSTTSRPCDALSHVISDPRRPLCRALDVRDILRERAREHPYVGVARREDSDGQSNPSGHQPVEATLRRRSRPSTRRTNHAGVPHIRRRVDERGDAVGTQPDRCRRPVLGGCPRRARSAQGRPLLRKCPFVKPSARSPCPKPPRPAESPGPRKLPGAPPQCLWLRLRLRFVAHVDVALQIPANPGSTRVYPSSSAHRSSASDAKSSTSGIACASCVRSTDFKYTLHDVHVSIRAFG